MEVCSGVWWCVCACACAQVGALVYVHGCVHVPVCLCVGESMEKRPRSEGEIYRGEMSEQGAWLHLRYLINVSSQRPDLNLQEMAYQLARQKKTDTQMALAKQVTDKKTPGTL